MRLTLRNMLASMDEILEPAQQEEIKRKIEESEFATGIMHRIRDVTRRIRLGAPKLTGKGMGLDPNTVAMYLDNTLSAERVPDFEKVCLESDVHLAEVAACHQVLALVLGEPAEVEPALRRRLYDLGQNAAPPEAEAPKIPPPLPASARQPTRRERPRVPDYLREERRSRWWTVAATLLLSVVLIAAVIRAIGPYDRTNRALAWLPIWPEEQVAQNGANGAVQKEQANDATADQGAAVPSDVNDNKTDATRDTATSASLKGALNNPLDQNRKAIPPDIRVQPADGARAPLPPEPDQAQALIEDRRTTADVVDSAAIKNDLPPRTADSAADAAPVDVVPARVASEPVGRFPTDPNVLLRLNRAGQWERVQQGAMLNANDRLLVLPTYRPNITLSAGLTMQVLGETLVELLPPDDKGVVGLRIPYGRVVLMTAGKPDVSINLSLGGRSGTATLVDAASTLAAEVRRFLPAGANPEREQAYVAVDLYATSGDIEWRVGESPEPKRISSPAHVTLGTPYPFPPLDAADPPKWISIQSLSGIDNLAHDLMNQALSEDNHRPVALTVREMAEDRRVELRYMAARSLALIDEFDPFIPAFNDSDQKGVWDRQIESLQAALARGPQTAAKVREAFERQRAGDADILYRMLWGYSKADIQSGVAAQLVEYLNHNSLDVRMLALYALRSVPGVPPRYSNFQPWATSVAERQQQVRRWREYIKDGPLSPKGALDRPGPAPKNQPQSISDTEE